MIWIILRTRERLGWILVDGEISQCLSTLFTTALQITQYNDAARNSTTIPNHSIWTLHCIDLDSFLTCEFNAPRVLSLSTKLPHCNLESPCVLRSYISYQAIATRKSYTNKICANLCPVLCNKIAR